MGFNIETENLDSRYIKKLSSILPSFNSLCFLLLLCFVNLNVDDDDDVSSVTSLACSILTLCNCWVWRLLYLTEYPVTEREYLKLVK